MARRFIVQVPVADLRGKPEELNPKNYAHNDLRLSQLLYGEKCSLITHQGEWIQIYALEQLRYLENKGWEPYSGWVHQSELKEVEQFPSPQHVIITSPSHSFGTYVTETLSPHTRPLSLAFNRSQLVEDAKLFVGAPYLWGGRASYSKNRIGSVDCSGFINLLYRAQGKIVPRDAHDQYLKSIPTPSLKPGDLIFLSKTEKISHLLLKLEDNVFIEAPETGKRVRLIRKGEDFVEEGGRYYFSDRLNAYRPHLRRLVQES